MDVISTRAGRLRQARRLATLLALWGLPYAAQAAFAPPATHPVGSAPVSLAAGDFNGDGFADLAVANSSSGSVSVLLGAADGSFGPMNNFPTLSGAGRIPTAVAARDFNGDGFLDLVVGFGGVGLTTSVQVMLGTGLGTFMPPITYAAGGDPWFVATGEFTGDASLDIAAANRMGGVSVLPGNGNGTFAAPVSYPTGDRTESVATGDLNRDGALDLVAANSTSDDLSILLADGAGGFQPASQLPIGPFPYGVAIGDLNGDGNVDIVVSDNIQGNVRVLLNNGAAVFAAQPPVATGMGASSVAIGDLNNDAFPDLAVANYFADTVSVLSGNGTGAFTAKDDYEAFDPAWVAITKLGADATPDLVFANEAANSVTVLLNTGNPGPRVFANGFEPGGAGR